MPSIPTSQLRADIRKWTWLWRFLKLWIKRSDTQAPWSAVHCWNESRWQTVCVAARACTRWWSPATRTLIRPSKPIVSVCSGFKGNTGQPGRKKKPHTVKCCSLPKGSGWQVFIAAQSKLYHESCRNMCTWTNKLQEQSAQAEKLLNVFFCSGWAYIMIQMKMIRMCLIVIIRWKACILQSWKIWTYFLQAKWT